ncbi:hypothetical protein BsWGS_20411 [Bradybaena similaris]
MPSASDSLSAAAQTEKPHHYMYLKEFRTQQCELFLQHKCQQHRPFTCFNWHFLNQRRRRPVKKRDGTFSYSPDIYCTKYDETTGICPDGDDCPFLHRTAGDTERRYHLRYYKTGTCVYETDSKGHCTKNGPHCAFAHGIHDVRPPVYDATELQPSMEIVKLSTSPGTSEKDRVLAEDPRWNDTNFVLANYKTEPCKRPPRLCRQGYACPQFHNTRDRRRSPKQYKYRSTPCPNVKHGDEWGDPTQCENGDGCSYCHTRTEQQFHPEIYKSTKCNDMVQTNSCPRGAFCAFAHVEQEITSVRDILSSLTNNSLAAFVTSILPQPEISNKMESFSLSQKNDANGKETMNGKEDTKLPNPIGKERSSSTSSQPGSLPISLLSNNNGNSYLNSLFDPFMRTRSSSVSSDYSISPLYMRAPGYERDEFQLKLRQQLLAIEKDLSIDLAEKSRRKDNLLLLHQMGLYSHLGNSLALTQSSTVMSPLAPAFYPPGDCVESVLGKAFDEVHLEDLDISSLEREMDKDMDNNSVSSSLSAGLSTSGCFSNNSSVPIGIPPSNITQRGSISSLSQSPPSPFGSFPHSLQLQKQDSNDHSSSPLFSCYSGVSKCQMGSNLSDTNSMSPRSAGPQSPMLSGSFTSNHQNGEIHKLREELLMTKSKMAEWEGVYNQAKCACEAWKKEAEDANKKAKAAEDEKQQAVKQKDEILNQNLRMQQIISMAGGPYIYALSRNSELDKLGVQQLQHLKQQLQQDVDTLDKALHQKMQRKV